MDTRHRMKAVFNYAAFQIGWFVLVLTQSPWSLVWALAFAAIHARILATPREWQRVGVIMAFGILVDLGWHLSPWVQFNGAGWPIPLWLVGLWIMFPLTLNHSLAWLDRRPLLQIVFGGIGGGGSYIAGAQFGAAEMAGPAYILIPLTWALWLPLFYLWYATEWPLRRRLAE
ncbi:DUF2878 domain-containing protein [Saccharospirillum salsuginis]|nr:DUF2878 domain-containing protein [Saccharospirillum salsuginis]